MKPNQIIAFFQSEEQVKKMSKKDLNECIPTLAIYRIACVFGGKRSANGVFESEKGLKVAKIVEKYLKKSAKKVASGTK